MQLRRIKVRLQPCAVLLVWVALIAFPGTVFGQGAGDPAKTQMQEMNRRELQLNNLSTDNRHANDPKRSQALMEQVSEDFQRILMLHNEIVRAIDSQSSLNLLFISDATAEIKKRSSRLQSLLQLKKPEPATAGRNSLPNVTNIPTKDGLIVLCKQIESFVRNPIIEEPGTINALQLDKARKDLQSVVEIADAIKKQVDKQKRQ
ncbi:MAG: hypothetical protein ABR555_14635 [Pyrinomonadaceae bacterium]